jgi:hypothetical protein
MPRTQLPHGVLAEQQAHSRPDRSVIVASMAQTRWSDVPRPLLYSAVTAIAFGLAGSLVGLILGLKAYPPTAWAAVFEVGAPAAFLGALLGLIVGAFAVAIQGRRS